MPQDLYEILELTSHATPDEIKRAYRKLARQYHPDINPDDPEAAERFKEIASAYEILSDPNRKARYDQFGETGSSSGMTGPFGDFTDLFSSFFGGTHRTTSTRPNVERGEDLEAELALDFEQAIFGTEAEVTVRTAVACEPCEATGAAEGFKPVSCTRCDGIGQIREMRRSILGQMLTQTICPSCNGSGLEISNPCEICKGEGREIKNVTIPIEIQPGVAEGNTLRLSDRGAIGRRGGYYGDLYIHLRVAEHPVLERQGDDLVHRFHIPMTQAALGVDLEYETLDSREIISVQPGTQSGHIFRLKGKGVPHLNGRGRGDFVIEVVVDTPTDLTSEQENILRDYADKRNEEVNFKKKRTLRRR
ncbi:MAG: Chaperone protein DnaJ [Acidimicrobiales bacterium AG-410-I20]|nr:MAG: Chaperone protein DnaJ [Acidimicrobiales bacterium AG-410-I20]